MSLSLHRYSHPFSLARDLLNWDLLPAEFDGRTRQGLTPTFDIHETSDAFHVVGDLPGLKEADLDVTFHNGILSISGQREQKTEEKDTRRHLIERRFGSFTRSFTLPDAVNGDSIEADLSAGVLTITIQKKPESKPIKISVGK